MKDIVVMGTIPILSVNKHTNIYLREVIGQGDEKVVNPHRDEIDQARERADIPFTAWFPPSDGINYPSILSGHFSLASYTITFNE
jgi:hypothetical protein